MATIPALEPHCGSWIVTSPEGRVIELFTERNVQTVADAGWRVETAAAYLGRINGLYRAAGIPVPTKEEE